MSSSLSFRHILILIAVHWLPWIAENKESMKEELPQTRNERICGRV